MKRTAWMWTFTLRVERLNTLDAAEMPHNPNPSVEGIKKTMEIYDSLEMRQHKPQDFYDDSFVRELDESGFIDSLYKD